VHAHGGRPAARALRAPELEGEHFARRLGGAALQQPRALVRVPSSAAGAPARAWGAWAIARAAGAVAACLAARFHAAQRQVRQRHRPRVLTVCQVEEAHEHPWPLRARQLHSQGVGALPRAVESRWHQRRARRQMLKRAFTGPTLAAHVPRG